MMTTFEVTKVGENIIIRDDRGEINQISRCSLKKDILNLFVKDKK